MQKQWEGDGLMEENWLAIQREIKEKEELALLAKTNADTTRFGLMLTEAEAKELITCRNESLARYGRVEFGKGILDKLIFAFCDSQYMNQDNYLETLEQLQDIFYEFKNETKDELTDDELLEFMREQFETVCFGSTEYLQGTCLEAYARSIRGGHKGYRRPWEVDK